MEQIVTLVSRVYDKDLSRLDQFESKGRSVILSNIINRYTHVLYINLSSFFKKFDEYIFLFRLCLRIEIFLTACEDRTVDKKPTVIVFYILPPAID